jgi:3-hydroxyisobutyrate dehydrogenase
MKIGFIGLGAMGRPMAANLERAGHDLQRYDVRPGEGQKPSVAEAARGCEVLFTSLPGPAEVESVAPVLKSSLAQNTAWFDLSTNSPTVVRRLNVDLAKKRIHFLDAPVSGGPKGAQSGKLAIWVGGEENVFRRFEPVLRAMGDQPYYVGPIGAGTVAKLAHNAASFTIQAALASVHARVKPEWNRLRSCGRCARSATGRSAPSIGWPTTSASTIRPRSPSGWRTKT